MLRITGCRGTRFLGLAVRSTFQSSHATFTSANKAVRPCITITAFGRGCAITVLLYFWPKIAQHRMLCFDSQESLYLPPPSLWTVINTICASVSVSVASAVMAPRRPNGSRDWTELNCLTFRPLNSHQVVFHSFISCLAICITEYFLFNWLTQWLMGFFYAEINMYWLVIV